MTVRTLLIVALALVFGVFSAIGISQLRPTETIAGPPMETVPVVVMTVDAVRGTIVTKEMVKIKDWPKSHAPKNAITRVEDALDRAITGSITADEPLLVGKVTKEKGAGGLASLLRPGMRAYTINTPSSIANVTGMVQPGNLVDVIYNLPGTDRTGILLQTVEILAVLNNIEGAKDGKNRAETVTLEVTPQQVLILAHAQKLGPLQLMLRGVKDDKPTDAVPIGARDLTINDSSPAPSPKPDYEGGFKRMLEALGRGLAARKPEEPKVETVVAPDPEVARERLKHILMIYNGKNQETREYDLPDEPEAKTGNGATKPEGKKR